MMCVHDKKTDSLISGYVRREGAFEKHVSRTIKALLDVMILNEGTKKTVFLDVGANIGMHTLYAAKLGYPVWAVDPQKQNIIKVRCYNKGVHGYIS